MSGQKARGSMTVFAAMSIMLVAAFLFALLESARIVEMRKMVRIQTDSVLESVFAAYVKPMWENYHLLTWNAGDGEQLSFSEKEAYIRDLSEEMRLSKKASLIQMEMTGVSFDRYLLLTDENGKAFVSAAAAYMQRFLPLAELKQIYGNYEAADLLEESQKGKEDALEKSLETIKTIEESEEDPKEEKAALPEELQENPLETVKKAKNSKILDLVVTDKNNISSASMEMSRLPSRRRLASGNLKTDLNASWLETVLFDQYLVSSFSNYTNIMEGRALNYELEYLLCGKGTDVDNLEGCVMRIIGIREVANLLYLMTDAAKQSEAMAAATAIAGASLNPAIVEIVKLGLLAAWAFAESVLDVRTLLNGGSIPLIKNSAQWTSDLLHLPSVFTGSVQAESSGGLDYTSYVGLLLFSQDSGRLAYRAMDLQESAVRMLDGYHDFCIDHMVLDAEITACYRAHSIFLGMESITAGMDGEFQLTGSSSYSYRKAGI